MKVDFNGMLKTVGQGVLLTFGWYTANFVIGFLPSLLAAIPRHG